MISGVNSLYGSSSYYSYSKLAMSSNQSGETTQQASAVSSSSQSTTSDAILAKYDTNGDGVLDSEELEAMRQDQSQQKPKPPMGGMPPSMGGFGMMGLQQTGSENEIDQDGDGSLDETELETLASVIEALTDESTDSGEIISEYDTNGDGILDSEEIAAMMADQSQDESSPPMGGMPPPMGGFGMAPPPPDGQAGVDQEGDGNATSSIESITGQPLDAEEILGAYDANEDGVLDSGEIETMAQAQFQQRPLPPMGGMTPPQDDAAAEEQQTSVQSADSSSIIRGYLQAYVNSSNMMESKTSNLFNMFI